MKAGFTEFVGTFIFLFTTSLAAVSGSSAGPAGNRRGLDGDGIRGQAIGREHTITRPFRLAASYKRSWMRRTSEPTSRPRLPAASSHSLSVGTSPVRRSPSSRLPESMP